MPLDALQIIDEPDPQEGLLANRIALTFVLAGIAEEEIDKYKRQHPDKKELIHDAFQFLMPTYDEMLGNTELFISHCRELLKRIVAGADLRLPTMAEIVCVLSQMSLRGMLKKEYVRMYYLAFKNVFGAEAIGKIYESEPPEGYAGEDKEILHILHNRFSRPDRVIVKEKKGKK